MCARAMDRRGIVVWLMGALAAGCQPSGGFKVIPIPADQSLEERIVRLESRWISDAVAIVDISGVLLNMEEPGLFGGGEHPVAQTVEKLNKAASDDKVKAVVLRINSPGGTVTASDILYQEILAFKKRTGKPVVASFQDVAASGAYYLACAADEIVAQRTSVTGSIGVIMQMFDISQTMQKIGVSSEAIKSGPFKDAGSPFRDMKPEERAIFQGMVDGFYAQFVDVVETGRSNLTREEVVKVADGRVYLVGQALEGGLIDRIGTVWDAVEAAQERAGIDRANVILYHRPLAWRPNVYARAPEAGGTTVNLLNLNLPPVWTNHPKFLYIWVLEGWQ